MPLVLPLSLRLPAFSMAASVPTLRALSCTESRESVDEGLGVSSSAHLTEVVRSVRPVSDHSQNHVSRQAASIGLLAACIRGRQLDAKARSIAFLLCICSARAPWPIQLGLMNQTPQLIAYMHCSSLAMECHTAHGAGMVISRSPAGMRAALGCTGTKLTLALGLCALLVAKSGTLGSAVLLCCVFLLAQLALKVPMPLEENREEAAPLRRGADLEQGWAGAGEGAGAVLRAGFSGAGASALELRPLATPQQPRSEAPGCCCACSAGHPKGVGVCRVALAAERAEDSMRPGVVEVSRLMVGGSLNKGPATAVACVSSTPRALMSSALLRCLPSLGAWLTCDAEVSMNAARGPLLALPWAGSSAGLKYSLRVSRSDACTGML